MSNKDVQRYWWCQSGMVDQESGLRPISFKTAAPETFVLSDTYDRDIKVLEGMIRELVEIVEDIDFGTDLDAPNNDDMNRWHNAALKETEGHE